MTVNYILKEKPNSKTARYIMLLIFAAVYFIVFEFILPYNNILPKPSLLPESLISLQSHYNLWSNLFYTVSGLYFIMALAYLVVTLLAKPIIKLIIDAGSFFSFLKGFRFFPLAGLMSIFIFWFPNSAYSELFFALFIALMYFIKKLADEIPNVRDEYIDPLIVLGVNNEVIYKDIIWKSCEPELIKSFTGLNLLLWAILPLFEFVKGNFGIGSIYRSALDFKDLSGLFIISLMLGVVIFLGEVIIRVIQKKLIQWEP